MDVFIPPLCGKVAKSFLKSFQMSSIKQYSKEQELKVMEKLEEALDNIKRRDNI